MEPTGQQNQVPTLLPETNQNQTYKCPGCPCVFCTPNDLNSHQKTFGTHNHQEQFHNLHRRMEHSSIGEDYDAQENPEEPTEQGWMKSRYGDGKECLHVDRDPRLSQALKGQPSITMGGFTYELSGNQKWILRQRSTY